MMTREYKSLGLKINLEVPSTVEEFDQNAKKEGACLAEAVNNCVYRGSLAEFRDLFLHGREADAEKGITEIKGIEQLTGVERLTEPVKGKDGKPVVRDGEPVTKYSESEGDYFERACETKGVEPSSFQSLADQVAASIKFDASAAERKPVGPKKLAAKYKVTAARIIAAGNVASFNQKRLSSINKTFTETGDTSKMFSATFEQNGETKTVNVSDKDAEALGWLVKEYNDWKTAQDMLEQVSE